MYILLTHIPPACIPHLLVGTSAGWVKLSPFQSAAEPVFVSNLRACSIAGHVIPKVTYCGSLPQQDGRSLHAHPTFESQPKHRRLGRFLRRWQADFENDSDDATPICVFALSLFSLACPSIRGCSSWIRYQGKHWSPNKYYCYCETMEDDSCTWALSMENLFIQGMHRSHMNGCNVWLVSRSVARRSSLFYCPREIWRHSCPKCLTHSH